MKPTESPDTTPGLALTPGAGPEHAPAGEPRRGLFTAAPVQYRVCLPGQQRAVLAEVDHTIDAADELVWAVFPEADPLARTDPTVDLARLFEATAVCLDLVFADGGRLGELVDVVDLVDHHGAGVTAAAQAGSRTLVIDQWNLKRVSLAALAGRRVVAVEVVTDTDTGTGWLEFLGLGDPADGPLGRIVAGDGTLAGLALTTRGSHSTSQLSRGLVVPVIGRPQAFTMVTPVTHPDTFGQAYQWHAGTTPDGTQSLAGFAVTHIPSPWMGDHGSVAFFPIPPAAGPAAARAGRARRRLHFRHGDEFARPHRYEVAFTDGTTAAVAATGYAVVAEFSSPGGTPAIVFDQLDDDGLLDLTEAGNGIVTGVARGASEMSAGALPLHFHAAFDRPVRSAELVTSDGRDSTHGVVEFEPGEGPVTMWLATSFLGADQARANLAEAYGRGVAEVAAQAAAEWDELLGLVRLPGAGPEATTTLVSNLYRMFLFPNIAHEPGPDGPRYAHRDADGTIGEVPGRRAVSNGFWDTYRTIWPALQLLRPDRAAELLDGFVEHFRTDGWMPRWSAPGASDLMVGTSSDNIIADAVVNGVELPDLDAAYDSALKNATVPSSAPQVGRKGLATGIFTGYIDTSVHEGMSWSLENAISDAGLAELATVMADRLPAEDPRRADRLAEAGYFRGRAANHVLLFDPSSGFYRGRTAAGEFRPGFDPAAWGGDYTETNAWGMAFTAPHDGHGLAFLHGGPAGLGDRLDAFFATPERATAGSEGWYGQIIHEMTEARNVRMGMFGPSNQPAHHIPFMYAFSDRPWALDPIVRECVRRLFVGSEIGQGYPGDEDNGEMSAWWFQLALGLYPLWGGSGEFVLCAPSFEEMQVTLPGGRELVVTTTGGGPGADHIQAVRVNGQAWGDRAVPFGVVAAGARIEVALGEQQAWAATARPPRSLTPAGKAPRRRADTAVSARLLLPDGRTLPAVGLVDNRAQAAVVLEPGAVIELELAAPCRPELLTLTAGTDPGSALSAWSVEAVTEQGPVSLGQWQDQRFSWPRQTRPFTLAVSANITGLRLRSLATEPVTLSQVEVLAEVG